MLRLSVAPGTRPVDAASLTVHVGGAESNTLAALAQLGRHCSWLSRLPDNALGHLVLRRIQATGVDTDNVVLSDEGRVGVYYFEPGAAPRAASVIYNRADSALWAWRAPKSPGRPCSTPR
jgi:2-dehydro-3-deoxygluconokinase